MSKLTIEEYWALYVLQFGKRQVWQSLTEEEDYFLTPAAADLLPNSNEKVAFAMVLDKFRKFLQEEEREGKVWPYNSAHE